MLGYLPDQRAAIGLGHPVFRLDLLLGIDASLERGELLGRLRAVAGRCLVFLVKTLCVHVFSYSRVANLSRFLTIFNAVCITFFGHRTSKASPLLDERPRNMATSSSSWLRTSTV